jgi:hypothetical protein
MGRKDRSACHEWVPGHGPDPAALARLAKRFSRPREPMGEAWFMGTTRRMYEGLMAPDPARWPLDELEGAIEALGSGPVCFGHMEEWNAWFPYLVHASIAAFGALEASFPYESLVSAIMVHCPDARATRYGDGFLSDVLATVGRLPLDPRSWEDGRVRADAFFAPLIRPPRGLMIQPGGSFNAAFYLAAKYLDEDSLLPWIASIAAIEDPLWRAKFVECLCFTAPLLLEEGKGPADLDGWVGGGWGWSHWVKANSRIPGEAGNHEFLGAQRRDAIADALRATLGEGLMASWADDLMAIAMEVDGLEAVVDGFGEWSGQVATLYALRD